MTTGGQQKQAVQAAQNTKGRETFVNISENTRVSSFEPFASHGELTYMPEDWLPSDLIERARQRMQYHAIPGSDPFMLKFSLFFNG